MGFRPFLVSLLTCALALCIAPQSSATVLVGSLGFVQADYDDTANTVTSGPVTHNNQTTGKFRDVFWWSINNGLPRVGSGDYINQGFSLVMSGNVAVPGSGPYTALNFTGPGLSGGMSYLSVYDTTPGPNGTAVKDLFDARPGIVVSADVLFAATTIGHNVSGGIVALYNEGQDGLALLASNTGGNNHDFPKLSLVWQSVGMGVTLASADLPASSFVGGNWYRLTMDVDVDATNTTWSLDGTIRKHQTASDPTSAVDMTASGLIAHLLFSRPLSDPNPAPGIDRVLTNPGEVGIMAMANSDIDLPDNVGVSVTNFKIDGPDAGGGGAVPEPLTMLGLAMGLGGLGAYIRKRRKA